MPTHPTLGEVDSIEPIDQTCPICETRILEIHQQETTWWGCECILLETVCPENWGNEVLYFMHHYPEKFDPSSLPRPIDLESDK
jgi:hypothetical protein